MGTMIIGALLMLTLILFIYITVGMLVIDKLIECGVLSNIYNRNDYMKAVITHPAILILLVHLKKR